MNVSGLNSGIQSLKTSCQSLDYSHIPEIPDNQQQIKEVVESQKASELLGMTHRKPCELNLFVDYDKEEKIESLE